MRIENIKIDARSGFLSAFLLFCAIASLSLLKFGWKDPIGPFLVFITLAVVTFRNGIAAARYKEQQLEAKNAFESQSNS